MYQSALFSMANYGRVFSDLILVFLIQYRQILSNTIAILLNTVRIPSEYRRNTVKYRWNTVAIPSNTVGIPSNTVKYRHQMPKSWISTPTPCQELLSGRICIIFRDYEFGRGQDPKLRAREPKLKK